MVCSTGALVETSNPILRAISLMRAGFNGIPPASIASIKLLACASGDVDTLRTQTRSANFFQSAKSGILLARIFHGTPLYEGVGVVCGVRRSCLLCFAVIAPYLGCSLVGMKTTTPTPTWVAGRFGVNARARHCMEFMASVARSWPARRLRRWASWKPDTSECAAYFGSPPQRV